MFIEEVFPAANSPPFATIAVMKAAWYEQTGPPVDVLKVGEISDPEPGEGEVRIRVFSSGINPGDVKKRQDTFGVGMAFPRIIPHSDGAGIIDAVGPGVEESRVGERVWCYGSRTGLSVPRRSSASSQRIRP